MTNKTVIVDLDGTLALIEHRRHFINPQKGKKPHWNKFFLACDKDEPNTPVIELVQALKNHGYVIHIFSGRSDIAKAKTMQWLTEHQVSYDHLTMRSDGDYTPDQQLKQNWLEQYYPNYLTQIFLVLDDRDKVVAMWRRLGLCCLQVAEGAF